MINLKQKGAAHILAILILFIGIIAGVYLVQHPQIFKPKAQELQEGFDYANWVTKMQSFGVYPAKDENGEIILYDRNTFVEKYCQPQGCYLNPSSLEELINDVKEDANFIHALGDKLRENDFAPIQALEPYFPEIKYMDNKSLGGALQALEPICRGEPEPICVPDLKTSISQDELTEIINQVSTERGLSEKDPIKNIISFTDPIFGTRSLINVLTISPNKVSDEDKINALLGLTFIYGLTEKVAAKGVQITADTVVNLSRLIDDTAAVRKSIAAGERVPLSVVEAKSSGWVEKGTGNIVRGLAVKNVAKMTLYEQNLYFKLEPLFRTGEAYIMDPNTTKSILSQLISGVESAYRSHGLPKLNRKAIMGTVDNNWVVVVKDNQYKNLEQGLEGAAAFTRDRVVVISESHAGNASNTAHEFVHVISSNNRLLRPRQIKPIGVYFSYDQNQADIYGATMSQIYELFTDEVVHVFGYREVYKLHYPNLSNSINHFVEALMRESRGGLTRADFSIFALTGDDKQLMQTLIKNGINPDRFMSIINKEIDGEKLAQIMRDYRVRRSGNKTWLIPTGIGGGAIFLGAFFAAEAHGEELPEGITIVYEPPDQDVDLTLSSSSSRNYLNCSYSQQDSNCSSGTSICTGHTPEDKCAGKQPGECFNLVGCAYDVNLGSSCSCTQ